MGALPIVSGPGVNIGACCGEIGIRTLGASQLNGFQDRRNRPLCHLSGEANKSRMENPFFQVGGMNFLSGREQNEPFWV